MSIPKSCMECGDCKKWTRQDVYSQTSAFNCRRTGKDVSSCYDKRHPECPVYPKDRFKEDRISTSITTEEIEKLDNDVFTLFDAFVDNFNSDTKLKSNTYFFYKDGIKISVKIEKELVE